MPASGNGIYTRDNYWREARQHSYSSVDAAMAHFTTVSPVVTSLARNAAIDTFLYIRIKIRLWGTLSSHDPESVSSIFSHSSSEYPLYRFECKTQFEEFMQ